MERGWQELGRNRTPTISWSHWLKDIFQAHLSLVSRGINFWPILCKLNFQTYFQIVPLKGREHILLPSLLHMAVCDSWSSCNHSGPRAWESHLHGEQEGISFSHSFVEPSWQLWITFYISFFLGRKELTF